MKAFSPAVCFLALSMFAGVAAAQTKDQTHKDWTVYSTDLAGKKTCYIASFPKAKEGNYKKRSEPYLMVTRVGKNIDEVSVTSGYPYKKGKDVDATIDGTKFSLVTDNEHAWAIDTETDRKLVQYMKKKSKMNVRGTSQKGTYSLDKYSLSGFTAAYKRMYSLCGN